MEAAALAHASFRPFTSAHASSMEAAIAREEYGKAVEVADGFWLLATRHRPGGAKQMAEINNRCLVFRLLENGAPILLVVNGVDPLVIPEVQRIERETGLTVRYVLSPGGGHHLQMRAWHDAFTHARVLLCPVRAPKTQNGKQLMQLPRVDTLDVNDPLPQFKGQLDLVLMTGLLSVKDLPAPLEGGPRSLFAMIKRMIAMFPPSMPGDELWLHHAATGTVAAGENLVWYYPKDRRPPFMLRPMLTPGRVTVQTATIRVGDARAVSEAWRKILAWPVRTLMSYHDAVGSAFFDDAHTALTNAVRAAGQLRE